MGSLIEDPALKDRIHVFFDRVSAGQQLAARLQGYRGGAVRLFAIPAGGVPVAAEIARQLEIPLDLIIVRKIQFPWTTEAGFGALNPAGQAVINKDLLSRMPLSSEEIEVQKQRTADLMREREAIFRKNKPYERLDGQSAMVVDDGLASGYTMRAALQFLKDQGAGALMVAVPTGSERTVWELLPLVDELYCLNVRGGFSFAVADAYENWYDLTEEEVLAVLASLTAGK
jgi:putative phosphoribosyl transferase